MNCPGFQPNRPSVLVLLAACALLPACAPPSAAPSSPVATPVELIVEPGQLTLLAGAQGQLASQANDATGMPVGGANFRYTVSEPRVLKVSDRGLVTSLGPVTNRSEVIIASGRSEKRVAVSVQPGPVRRLEIVSGAEVPVKPGATDVVFKAVDAFGNPAPHVALSVRLSETSAAVQPLRTNDEGIVTVPVQQPLREPALLIVEAAEYPAVRQSVRVEPAPASATVAP